jgi:hypothetical protein
LDLRERGSTGVEDNLHNEELYNFHPSSIIIRVIKAMGVRWEDM